jgi:hypothetical protein
MKLSSIAKGVLTEIDDMQPEKQPATAQPPEQEKLYDVLQDFQNFQTVLDKQIETAKKGLESTVSSKLLNKKVVCRASKGAIGQVEKDYRFTCTAVGVSQMKEDYYIVLKDKEKKDYYVNTAFKIKISGAGSATEPTTSSDSPKATILEPPDANSKGYALKGNQTATPSGFANPKNAMAGGGKNLGSSL